MSDPGVRGVFGAHVGLVREFGFVEGDGCFDGGVGVEFGGEVLDYDGVTLNGDELEGGFVGVGGWVGGPVVEPGDFTVGFGEGVGGVLVFDGPAEAAFGGRHCCFSFSLILGSIFFLMG